MQNQISSKSLDIRENPEGAAAHPIAPSKAFRFGTVVPLAAVMTIGLTISMAALIATEFSPQDKAETVSFEINPRVDDILEPKRTERPDPLKKVETPPAPPTVDTIKTAAVNLPIVEVVGKKTEFDIDKIDLGPRLKTVSINKDVTPIFRTPPVFPARFIRGDFSGYCRVRFDINPEGKPFNVEIRICTDNRLEKATIKSVQKWKYAPQVEDGRPVSRFGLETKIRFEIRDERGELLPLPSGF